MWLDGHYRSALEHAGLAAFEQVMGSSRGRCLRVLGDRENWYLGPADLGAAPGRPASGMYLKKHCRRTWATWLWAKLGLRPGPGAGRAEAQYASLLAALGIPVMRVVACGEDLRDDGRLESFLLTEELFGYSELEGFLRRRFSRGQSPGWRDGELRGLLGQVAWIARRLHASGYNHRDLNCYHFLVREPRPGRFEVRLIDLQRVQHRRRRRRRWIVKDLAQLAASAPEGIGCREKIAFLREYLGIRRLGPRDKRLVRSILLKQRLMAWRQRRKA
jgi:heptose I phosphotransferase